MPVLASLPVLLVFGGADAFTTAKKSLPRFERAFPNHESVVIPRAGHFFPESAPEQTTAAIEGWLEEHIRDEH